MAFDGAPWRATHRGLEPEWRREPTDEEVRAVVSEVLGWSRHTVFTADLVLHEPCSRHYIVWRRSSSSPSHSPSPSSSSYLLRVFPGLDPQRKTLCEVATADFVRRKFKLPVPTVRAFDSRCENELGFEWILTDRIPHGTPLVDCWSTLSWAAKERLVQRLGSLTATMFQRQFHGIGALMPDRACIRRLQSFQRLESQPVQPQSGMEMVGGWITRWWLRRLGTGEDQKQQDGHGPGTSSHQHHIEQVVSPDFFWGDRARQNVARGPFQTSRAWLSARLRLLEAERIDPVMCFEGRMLFDEEKERVRREAHKSLQMVRRLKQLLPRFFPGANDADGDAEAERPERTVLSLQHVGWEHILVDDAGKLTALVGCWENVSTLPLWKACTYPAFLDRGRDRDEPANAGYDEEEEEEEEEDGDQEERLGSELTRLRAVFLDGMQQLAPQWEAEFRRGESRRDFERAVRQVDCGERLRAVVSRWLGDVERYGRDGARERGSMRERLDDLNTSNDDYDDGEFTI